VATTALPTDVAPGPSGLELLRTGRMLRRDSLGALHQLRERYGRTWRLEPIVPGMVAFTGTSSATGIRQALTDRAAFGKATPGYQEMGRVLGDGLLTSTGDRWVAQRRTIQPLFTRRRVHGYAADFDAATADTLASWPDEGTVDLDGAMRELTVRAASVTLFGLDAYDLVAPMLGDVVTMSELVMQRAFRPFGHIPIIHTAADRRFDALRERIEGAIRDLVDQRNAEVDGTDDLVGLLQAARDPETGEALSEQDVLDQAVVFLLAGHETTSTALTFALWELARRPDLQDAVREEARAALPAKPGADADAIGQLDLTRRVLDEAMRLHSPVPITARSVEHDNEVDGHLVRKGEVVMIDFAGVHTDPEHWDDPARFDPDRFLPEVTKQRDAYAYLPFGGGPRSCIGNHFALLEATAALGRIVRDRRLSDASDERVPISVGITMTPSRAVHVRTSTVR
jgi:cytochrome P450